jgi:hypothetical protein
MFVQENYSWEAFVPRLDEVLSAIRGRHEPGAEQAAPEIAAELPG